MLSNKPVLSTTLRAVALALASLAASAAACSAETGSRSSNDVIELHAAPPTPPTSAATTRAASSAPSDFSTYEKEYAYLTFDYPKGWSIGNDEELDGGQMLFVYGPNDAVVGFMIVPQFSTMTIDEYAKSVHDDHTKSFAERGISIGPVSTRPAKARIGGVEVTGIEHNFVLSPASESAPRLDQFFLVTFGHKKVFISVQLSDEDLEAVRPGLTRIYDTLRAPRK